MIVVIKLLILDETGIDELGLNETMKDRTEPCRHKHIHHQFV